MWCSNGNFIFSLSTGNQFRQYLQQYIWEQVHLSCADLLYHQHVRCCSSAAAAVCRVQCQEGVALNSWHLKPLLGVKKSNLYFQKWSGDFMSPSFTEGEWIRFPFSLVLSNLSFKFGNEMWALCDLKNMGEDAGVLCSRGREESGTCGALST